MLFRHDASYCFEETLGTAGVSRARVAALAKGLTPPADTNAAALFELPARTNDLAGIEGRAAHIRKHFRHVVIAGAGGSTLSGRALTWLKPVPADTTLHFLDNIDPDLIEDVLTKIDLRQTFFIIISKSGETVETLGQFYVLLARAKAAVPAKNLAERFVIITTAGENSLRKSAAEHGFAVLTHESDIGGRFSALTQVGLLPAAIAGLDIRALRQGARSVLSDGVRLAAEGAALQFALMEKGKSISVMLPYAERLAGFSSWYRQSWAESLGKGGKGTTPIRAVGATDQHSQLQLYLDGPKDKLFHLITIERAGSGQKVEAPEHLSYLQGKTTGDIMEAEQKATLATLVKNRCPVRHFALTRLGEEEMGALIMHFTLEILFMAQLLGVNPFDQPAVEEGKRLAREYLRGETP